MKMYGRTFLAVHKFHYSKFEQYLSMGQILLLTMKYKKTKARLSGTLLLAVGFGN